MTIDPTNPKGSIKLEAVDPAPRTTTGVAALGTLWVGVSTSDLLIVALRVDVGGVLKIVGSLT